MRFLARIGVGQVALEAQTRTIGIDLEVARAHAAHRLGGVVVPQQGDLVAVGCDRCVEASRLQTLVAVAHVVAFPIRGDAVEA